MPTITLTEEQLATVTVALAYAAGEHEYDAVHNSVDDNHADDLQRRADAVRGVLGHLESPAVDAERPGVSFTRDQIEAWVGFPLTDDQMSDLEDVLPNSSLPDCVGTVATEALGFTDEPASS